MRKLVAGLALGVSSAAVVLAIGAGGWLDRAEMATYDWRTRLTADRSRANPDIVLVEINDSVDPRSRAVLRSVALAASGDRGPD